MGHYKQCKVCGEEKSTEEFTTKNRVKTQNGLIEYKNHTCNPCRSKQAHEYRQVKPYQWICSRYKVDEQTAKYWHQRSMTSCEICGKQWEEGKEKLCIDHDHSTGKVRGILCKHCNHVLGHSRESLTILDNAKAYLISHREN